MIAIIDNYKGFVPPKWVRRSIERLLASVSPEHLVGLQSIVLTNTANIGRGKTRRIRGRKYALNACLAFYHPASRQSRAWIELSVDTTIAHWPGWLLVVPFFQDVSISETLYHEIGHHLDATLGSAKGSSEAAANDWCRRLMKKHARQRYWYWRPFVRGVIALAGQVKRLARAAAPR